MISLLVLAALFSPGRGGRASPGPFRQIDPIKVYTNSTPVTVSNASGVLVAADAGALREVILVVPSSAATGVHVAFGAVAATTNHLLLEPGFYVFETDQEIRAIRGGASDVTVYRATSEV